MKKDSVIYVLVCSKFPRDNSKFFIEMVGLLSLEQ